MGLIVNYKTQKTVIDNGKIGRFFRKLVVELTANLKIVTSFEVSRRTYDRANLNDSTNS